MSKKEHAVRDPEKLSILFELSRAFSSLIELEDLLAVVNAKTQEVLNAESCAILFLDEATQELFFPVASDVSPEVATRLKEVRFPADRGVAGWVLGHGEPAIVPDVSKDERFYSEVDRASGATTRDLLYAPLRTRHGVLGVIGLRNKRVGSFTDEDLAFLDALAGPIAVAIENARLYAHVKASEERLRTQVGALRRDLARHDQFTEIVGSGPTMAEVFRLMESAATSPIAVLIEGETGTGKELVARGIHRASDRADAPFLAVNCAALPETLLESELFGHRRGTFTGAIQDKRGLFEAATGGTIFLDEVGDMPAVMQVKLLRVLQDGEVIPLGDTRPRKVDVRVISATNRDLNAEVAAHRFRGDLYYRIGAFPIQLPPLRTRREDIPLIAARVVAAASARIRKRIAGIETAALEFLIHFDWPGNVRQLQNEIERAVALARDGDTIGLAHLSSRIHAEGLGRVSAAGIAGLAAQGSRDIGVSLRRSRAAFEARYIAEVLRENGGNVTKAAKVLGMSRVTLHKKMNDYRLR